MKTVTFLSLLTSIGMPTVNALVGSSWSVTNAPSTGITDLTFPLTIVQTVHKSGYYFAQQFAFANTSSVGYTGLQPRPNIGTRSRLHAVFSSFVAGSTSTDPNCSPGADDGPGVSCSFEFDGVYNRTYDLEVVRSPPSSQTWVGTAIDTVTKTRIHIGSYTLPARAGNIESSQLGFVEWYPWNGGEPPNHCAKLPYQKSTFGVPKTSSGKGSQSLAYEYGDCVGKVAFRTQATAGGMQCECGF